MQKRIMMTEAVAFTKVCPVRTVIQTEKKEVEHKCVGSDCMLWGTTTGEASAPVGYCTA